VVAFRPALTVSVAEPGLPGDAFTLVGLIVAVTPRGRPPVARLTVPANPFAEVTVIVAEAVRLVDVLTVRLAGLAVRVREPPGVTVTVTSAE
jgi:hypothetical protein